MVRSQVLFGSCLRRDFNQPPRGRENNGECNWEVIKQGHEYAGNVGRRLHLPHLDPPLALFIMYPPLNLDHVIKTTLIFQGWNSLDLVGCADVAALVSLT